MDAEELASIFKERPALHRFPGSMAARVQEVCRTVAQDYGNKAANVWKGTRDGAELLARIKALPGFGEQKAKIFVALLGKQLGVRPDGWQGVSQALRGRRHPPLGGRHHRRREHGAGPGGQEGGEGEGQGARLGVSGRFDLALAPALSVHAGSARPARVRRRLYRGRRRCRPTAGQAPRRPPAPRSSPTGRHGVSPGRRPVRAERPPRSRPGGEADGVHVGQDDVPVALARRILGPDAIVGLSTHSPSTCPAPPTRR